MSISLRPADDKKSRKEFVRLARHFRGAHPCYVAPVESEVLKLLDTKKNPAFAHATQQLWIAEDATGRVRGRIAATYDPRHAENLGENAGWFGFFDADGLEVTRILLDQAWNWLRERGAESMLGPADPDTNHECGCLIEGFDELPFILMPHNPPEYEQWLADAGLVKAKDLLAYESHADNIPLERMEPIVERTLERGGFKIKAIDANHLGRLLEVARKVYNHAWRENWGFLPMTKEEFEFEAQGLKMLIKPEMAYVATLDGEPAGFILGLPDINVALKKIDSKLFPFGWIRMLLELRKVNRCRVIAMGVMPEFRNRGLDGLLVYYITRGAVRVNLPICELSWVLEDNQEMTRLAKTYGGSISRRYRIFRRSAAAAS